MNKLLILLFLLTACFPSETEEPTVIQLQYNLHHSVYLRNKSTLFDCEKNRNFQEKYSEYGPVFIACGSTLNEALDAINEKIKMFEREKELFEDQDNKIQQ